MRLSHIAIGILIAAIWGVNFTFVKLGLNELPPLFLCGLRFLFVSIPLVFYIKIPKVPFKTLFTYSMLTFFLQFSLLFLALKLGMPAGMSSVVFQIQVFISLLIAAIVFKEQPKPLQILGGIIAFIGIGFVWLDIKEPTTLIGLIIEILAATSWAFGNIYSKKMVKAHAYSLVVWGCLLSTAPIFILSLLFEGPNLVIHSLKQASWISFISVAYTSVISTGVGYVLWNRLLSIYPVSTIIPFTLLIPIFGMCGSMLVFGEVITSNKIIATTLIICGLSMNILVSNSTYRLRRITA